MKKSRNKDHANISEIDDFNFSLFAIYVIHFKFVGIKDMHNIYYLGLSGERSLPFGLLDLQITNSTVIYTNINNI